MLRGCLILSIAGLLVAQIGPPVAPNGTITGVVTDAGSGTPLAEVLVSSGGANAVRSTTNEAGQFKLAGLPPGSYRLSAEHAGRITVYQYTHVDPGQSVTLDLHIAAEPVISGIVVDENQNPISSVPVLLIRSEYQGGVLRHIVDRSETTRRDGTYAFSAGLETGREYLLLARRINPTADAPADRAQRKAVSRSTYFPESPTLEGALPLTLQAGEHRERVNIRMPNFKPLCVDGTVTAAGKPAAAGLLVDDDALPGLPGLQFSSAADGRFRTCGLTSGKYRMTVTGDQLEGARDFQISDSDVHALNIEAGPTVLPRLEVAWDTPPPDGMGTPYVHIAIAIPGGRTFYSLERSFPFSGALGFVAPGEFDIAATLGPGLYVKQMTYGGVEVLQHRVKFSGAGGNTTLRIVVGRDGSTMAVTVNDADGHAVPQAPVLIIPETVTSVPQLAAHMILGQTDQAGVYNSATLAPGRYAVLACGRSIRMSPEDLGRLFDARSKAHAVELIPRATATATIQPVSID